MQWKQNVPSDFVFAADVPTLTAGVAAYTEPATLLVAKGGGSFGAAASTFTSGAFSPNCPYLLSVTCLAADVDTVGAVVFMASDASDNVIGFFYGQVFP